RGGRPRVGQANRPPAAAALRTEHGANGRLRVHGQHGHDPRWRRNAIDLTLGVTLGLSTLAAAACGQICSDVAGVTFGGAIESAAMKLGLPSPGFTEEQRRESIVKRLHILGSVVGVICGCSLGLVNLLLIDASEAKDRSSSPPPAPTAAIHRRDNQPGARRLHGHHYRGAGHEGPHGLRGHGPEQRELHARGARA
ncbi:unnamed protein product, partial [Prorocentrum cordatum]